MATLENHTLICFLHLIVCKEQAALISEVCEEFWQTNYRLHSCNSCKFITVSGNFSGFCLVWVFLTLDI